MRTTKDDRIKFSKFHKLSLLQMTTLVIGSAALGVIIAKYQLNKSRKQHRYPHYPNINNIPPTISSTNNIARNTNTNTNYKTYRIVCFGDSITWGRNADPTQTNPSQLRLPTQHRWVNILSRLLNTDSSKINNNNGHLIKQMTQNSNNSNKYSLYTSNNINNNSDNNEYLTKYEYEVISEGLCGRTINHVDKSDQRWIKHGLSMNGMDQILPILYSHKPIDLVVLMLGINDCKSKFIDNKTIDCVSNGMEKMLDMVCNSEVWSENATHKRVLLIPCVYIRHLTDKMVNDWKFNEKSLKLSQQIPSIYKKISMKEKYNGLVEYLDVNSQVSPGKDGIHLDREGNEVLGQMVAPVVKNMLGEDVNEKKKQVKFAMI